MDWEEKYGQKVNKVKDLFFILPFQRSGKMKKLTDIKTRNTFLNMIIRNTIIMNEKFSRVLIKP